MKISLLFMDECMSDRLDIAALTGVLVPSGSYAAIRDEMCRLVWRCLDSPPSTIPQPIELHGAKLLKEIEGRDRAVLDELRLDVFATAVRIVNDYRLSVYRVAYTNRSQVARGMHGDPNLYALNFLGIQGWLSDVLADTLVWPVMDGIPDTSKTGNRPAVNPQLIRSFSGYVRSIHHYRAAGVLEAGLSLRNSHNLAEPTYSDSAHSILLQLVDLVSYLLHQIEKAEMQPTKQLSDFSSSVLGIARQLDASLLQVWRGQMNIHGAVAPTE